MSNNVLPVPLPIQSDHAQPLTAAQLAAMVVLTKDSLAQAAQDGLVYSAGVPLQTTAATQSASASLHNPAESGRALVLVGMLLQVDVAMMMMAMFLNGGTQTGTLRTPMNHAASGPASVAAFRGGIDTLTGATEMSPQIYVRDLSPLLYQGPPIIILPGELKSVRITGATLTTINYRFNATWLEVPLG